MRFAEQIIVLPSARESVSSGGLPPSAPKLLSPPAALRRGWNERKTNSSRSRVSVMVSFNHQYAQQPLATMSPRRFAFSAATLDATIAPFRRIARCICSRQQVARTHRSRHCSDSVCFLRYFYRPDEAPGRRTIDPTLPEALARAAISRHGDIDRYGRARLRLGFFASSARTPTTDSASPY